MTWSLKLAMKNSFLRINYDENVGKQSKILNENVDKQSQNTHVEVNIFARQKSKTRSRVSIVQNYLHIGETYRPHKRNLHIT